MQFTLEDVARDEREEELRRLEEALALYDEGPARDPRGSADMAPRQPIEGVPESPVAPRVPREEPMQFTEEEVYGDAPPPAEEAVDPRRVAAGSERLRAMYNTRQPMDPVATGSTQLREPQMSVPEARVGLEAGSLSNPAANAARQQEEALAKRREEQLRTINRLSRASRRAQGTRPEGSGGFAVNLQGIVGGEPRRQMQNEMRAAGYGSHEADLASNQVLNQQTATGLPISPAVQGDLSAVRQNLRDEGRSMADFNERENALTEARSRDQRNKVLRGVFGAIGALNNTPALGQAIPEGNNEERVLAEYNAIRDAGAREEASKVARYEQALGLRQGEAELARTQAQGQQERAEAVSAERQAQLDTTPLTSDQVAAYSEAYRERPEVFEGMSQGEFQRALRSGRFESGEATPEAVQEWDARLNSPAQVDQRGFYIPHPAVRPTRTRRLGAASRVGSGPGGEVTVDGQVVDPRHYYALGFAQQQGLRQGDPGFEDVYREGAAGYDAQIAAGGKPHKLVEDYLKGRMAVAESGQRASERARIRDEEGLHQARRLYSRAAQTAERVLDITDTEGRLLSDWIRSAVSQEGGWKFKADALQAADPRILEMAQRLMNVYQPVFRYMSGAAVTDNEATRGLMSFGAAGGVGGDARRSLARGLVWIAEDQQDRIGAYRSRASGVNRGGMREEDLYNESP